MSEFEKKAAIALMMQLLGVAEAPETVAVASAKEAPTKTKTRKRTLSAEQKAAMAEGRRRARAAAEAAAAKPAAPATPAAPAKPDDWAPAAKVDPHVTKRGTAGKWVEFGVLRYFVPKGNKVHKARLLKSINLLRTMPAENVATMLADVD